MRLQDLRKVANPTVRRLVLHRRHELLDALLLEQMPTLEVLERRALLGGSLGLWGPSFGARGPICHEGLGPTIYALKKTYPTVCL